MDKLIFSVSILLVFVANLPGLVSGNCSQNCRNNTENPADPKCNGTSGECLYGCVDGYTGLQCQLPCPDRCTQCNITSQGDTNETVCTLCDIDNYKDNGGCVQCSDTCQSNPSPDAFLCNPENGSCNFGCKEDHYGIMCQQNCSDNCFKNMTVNSTVCRRSDGFCEQGCQFGYYGPQCDMTCNDGCVSGDMSINATCHQDTGHCDYGCIEGYYGEDCSEICSQYCRSNNDSVIRACNETNGHCEFGCQDGFYGFKCDKRCSEHCIKNDSSVLAVCDSVDGTCTSGCDNSSYGARCDGTCSTHCLTNTSEARDCNETNGHCIFGCENGFYGELCNEVCSKNCLENSTYELCQRLDGTCNSGCKEKFFGLTCKEECVYFCKDQLCDDGPSGCCFDCQHSHLHGCRCNHQCSAGCYPRECYQNGTCEKGCKTNFWGPTCTACSGNCNGAPDETTKCDVTNGSCLYECKVGFYGARCSQSCPTECKDNQCNQSEGNCTHGCKNKFYGERCQYQCNTNCPEESCFASDGTCVQDCPPPKYGLYCEKRCPENCMDNTCYRENGTCSLGCKEGYFGEVCETVCLEGTYGHNCDKNCSEGCINGTCSPDSGNCGCISGYTNDRCADRVRVAPPPVTKPPIIEGSIGGAAVILLTIGVVVLCIWRKKKKEKLVQRRKPKNRRSFASALLRPITMLRKSAGPKRILVDNLLTTVEEMSVTSSDFKGDFNGLEEGLIKDHLESLKQENLTKNCHIIGIKPYDENRVVLQADKERFRRTIDFITGLADMGSDYINASYIEGYGSAKHRYIAAQGPILATRTDFWKMVFQEKTSLIIMLVDLEEREHALFKKYWPEVDTKETFANGIVVEGLKEERYADFCVRTMKVQYNGEERVVTQLQFTSWSSSDDAPASAAAMIEFFHKFRSIEPEEDTPIVVHCTSGVGRTGCFIALDLLVDEGEEDHSVDVCKCVSRLREQRVNMVQYEDQYIFVYKTVAQILGLRSYPVDKDKLGKEWTSMKKDDNTNKIFDDLCDSVRLDDTDYNSISKNQDFTDKNREGSDTPEDKYRPKLPDDDYINAVYIDTYRKKNGMIVTQMPTPDTLPEFLRLVYQEQCNVIVMMNEEDANDQTQAKYWPSLQKSTKHGNYFVTTNEIFDKVNFLEVQLTLTDLTKNNIIVSKDWFHIRPDFLGSNCKQWSSDDDQINEMKVTLYQFARWKAGENCPSSDIAFLSLTRELVKETSKNYSGRILVHCLNGSERSGLFCSLYILLEKLNSEKGVSVVNTVRKIKTRRPTAIPDLDQFSFLYECLQKYIEEYPSEILYRAVEIRQKKPSHIANAAKRISQLYSRPDKRKTRMSVVYAKPDKDKKDGANGSNGFMDVEVTGHISEQPQYAMVNKKQKRKSKSKSAAVSIEDITEVSIEVENENDDNFNGVNMRSTSDDKILMKNIDEDTE